jgi:hypothetical protein
MRPEALRVLSDRAHRAGRLDARRQGDQGQQNSNPRPPGKDFVTADPLIYVQVFVHTDKQQSLADFARTSNARWIAANAKSKITELPAVERANGKPAFLRFGFENPAKAEQAFEVGAFGIDSDKDGNEFVLDVVMSGASKEALDAANEAYLSFLKAH